MKKLPGKPAIPSRHAYIQLVSRLQQRILKVNESEINNRKSKMFLAERVGFEPTERFPAHSISSAANSTTLAPLPKNFGLRISNCEMQSTPGSTKLTVLQIRISKSAIRNSLWRRGWDSNPRWALTHSGFRDRCTNPLCDLSASKVAQTLVCESFNSF